jgi:hypothetical protein
MMNAKTFVNARLDYLIRTHALMQSIGFDLNAPTFEAIEQEAHRQSIRGQIAFYQGLKTIYDAMEECPNEQITITSSYRPRLRPLNQE